jgi:4-amino-4-deoxy-L-arabinose transferase-like glycosyltransferase
MQQEPLGAGFGAKALLNGFARNPLWSLMTVTLIGLVFRLHDPDAVPVWGDEFHDTHFSLFHAEYPNPFNVPLWLYGADPSQARLPYYLTAAGIRLLSGGSSDTFLKQAGQVRGSGVLGWATVGVVIGLACIGLLKAAPPPLGRWAAVVPLGCAILLMAVMGIPRFPVTQLVAARVVSGIVGACAVPAAYALGREAFGHRAGLFAAAALAVCPTHIGWSRHGVTAGDTFVTTAFTLALWLLYRMMQRGSGPLMMACAASFGLALGAKFSAVLLLPISVLYAAVLLVSRAPVGLDPVREPSVRKLRRATLLHLGLVPPLLIVFLLPFAAGGITRGTTEWVRITRAFLWTGALGVYSLGFVRLFRCPWTFGRRHLIWVALNLCIGGGITAAFITPYHAQAEALIGMMDWWHEAAAPQGTMHRYLTEFVQMMGLSLVATKVPMNLLAVVAIVMACRPANLRWGSLFLITLGLYMTAITLLEHRFTYYVMPLLPLLYVLAGAPVERIWQRLALWRPAAGRILGAAVSLVLAFQLFHAAGLHPYYLLDEKPWERRAILWPDARPLNTQLQGIRPVVEWVCRNVPEGTRAVVLLPDGMAARPIFHGWVSAVLNFETQRVRPMMVARRISFDFPDRPLDLSAYDYLLFFPLSWGDKPHLENFEDVYSADLNGVPGAWILRRSSRDTPRPRDLRS